MIIECFYLLIGNLRPQKTDTAGGLDAFFGLLREVLGLDDDWLCGKVTSSQQLVVALEW